MGRPPTRKPVEWRQLCAIARDVLTRAPTIHDFEWKERIKDRLFQLQLTYPQPIDRINRAMDAVQRALEKEWGPRPIQQPPPLTTRPSTPLQRDRPWGRHERRTTGFTSLASLMDSLRMTSRQDSGS